VEFIRFQFPDYPFHCRRWVKKILVFDPSCGELIQIKQALISLTVNTFLPRRGKILHMGLVYQAGN
jgi:hypothetical protein